MEKPATAPAQAFPEYVAAGQKLLTSGHPQEASLWLFRAYERGSRELLLRQLLADALRQSAQLPVRLPGEKITDVSLSRDGKLVVLLNSDDESQIALYDAETGRLLQTLEDPREDNQSAVSEVMFLPDRRILSLHRHEANIQDILHYRPIPEPPSRWSAAWPRPIRIPASPMTSLGRGIGRLTGGNVAPVAEEKSARTKFSNSRNVGLAFFFPSFFCTKCKIAGL